MTDALRIAIVHYHLRPGGVTSVIKQAVTSLEKQGCRIAVLAGSEAPEDMPGAAACHAVEGLNYAAASEPPCSPNTLVERLDESARKTLGGPPDIWHIHNHSLGKNCVLTHAMSLMAARGSRLLLQIHDFPEDGRPANYRDLLHAVGWGDRGALGARLYPQAAHVLYAVLNERDAGFLSAAGCPDDRVRLLPNAVSMRTPGGEIEELPDSAKGPTFLYPTRAIRRKNIGEFVLWSAMGVKNDRFATTLAPTSSADLAVYRRWKEFAASCSLPVEFEVGLDGRVPFPVLLKSAHAIVTTSVAEGFGLAFLEPWLVGRPLVGRDLPEMTQDFKREGMDLSTLYSRVLVPVSWVGLDTLRRKLESGLAGMMLAYGRMPKSGDVDLALQAAVENDRIDFGRLDEELQEQIIRRVHGSPAAAAELRPLCLVPDSSCRQMIEANGRIVRRQYNAEQYGDRLMDLYKTLMKAAVEPVGVLHAESLLDKFLAPERFYLIRT